MLKLIVSELSSPQNCPRQNFDLRTGLRGIATIVQQAVARGATSHMPALVPSVRPHSVVFIAQADGSRMYSPAKLRQVKAHPRMSEVAVA